MVTVVMVDGGAMWKKWVGQCTYSGKQRGKSGKIDSLFLTKHLAKHQRAISSRRKISCQWFLWPKFVGRNVLRDEMGTCFSAGEASNVGSMSRLRLVGDSPEFDGPCLTWYWRWHD